MSKLKKTVYFCQNCGSVQNKWSGKCPDCGSWNSLLEENQNSGLSSNDANKQYLKNANEIEIYDIEQEVDDNNVRVLTNIEEIDRVLGGGLVKGSTILIAGDPGIGKSTLLLQISFMLSKSQRKTFYISGEESVSQIHIRAKRIGFQKGLVKVASASNIMNIIKTAENKKNMPEFIIIDSIQTMYSEGIPSVAGTISQIRASLSALTIFAKNHNITLLIISHITKDGQIAGPKLLEHMVDVVCYFEGEKDSQYRMVRTIKNRFGAANEIGVFEMSDCGLVEVSNPSKLFLSNRESPISGVATFATVEGSRVILAEVQTLISPSYMPSPRRAVVGWDGNRLALIIAVLNSRFGLNLSDKEVYLNIASGLKVQEPAADLSAICALISTAKNIPIPLKTVVIGEVALTGEVRMTSLMENRIRESLKLGFTHFILPSAIVEIRNFSKIKKDINLFCVDNVIDLHKFFNNTNYIK